ncbi:MAG: transcriptional regulator [Spirochaetota bacterium]
MSNGNFVTQVHEDFSKARMKARLGTLVSTLQFKRSDLLSLYDVKELLKPKAETYVGVRAIPIEKIIGSEGRYRDFSNEFFPKKEMLKGRWQSIDTAHLKYVELPPVSVYKLGDAYFVRDGNHRVSVAKLRGIEFIDASIVELDTEISLEPGMTLEEIKDLVISYERGRFLEEYQISEDDPMADIRFTTPGRYTEMLHHIEVHKYYLNEHQHEEIPFKEAMQSWYKHIYLPIIEEIRNERLLVKCPGRTEGDLYMWILKHREELKGDIGHELPPDEVTRDFTERYSLSFYKRLLLLLKRLFTRRQ